MSALNVESTYAALPLQPRGLAIVRAFFTRLHEAEIAYCHWKSNEHLGPALEGLTDLDILVERHRSAELQGILAGSGFKHFTSAPRRAYPAVEDYLGFDPETGRLVHLHLHHQLTLGQPYLKGYRLPWESRILAARVPDVLHGIHVAEPAHELVLLLVRRALKARARDGLRRAVKRSAGRDNSDYAREYAWLRERVDDERVACIAREWLGLAAGDHLVRCLIDASPGAAPAFSQKLVKAALERHRTFSTMSAASQVWLREAHRVVDVLNRRLFHRPVPLRRISSRGGAVIVLLGSDGSGKSSLRQNLVSWLGAKLDVMPIYFGSGDGASSFYRQPLRIAHRALGPFLRIPDQQARDEPREANGGRSRRGGRVRRLMRACARLPWALTLSLEKRGKLRQMIRARNRGMIVVCDRFPQAEIPGFNDGPLLAHWRESPSRICRFLARWEARPYEEARNDPPDLVIKLAVTPEVALERRPEMKLSEIRRRVAAVQSLGFPAPARVALVASDRPLDEVSLAAKRLVWEIV